jgi:hypothetical protein
MDWATFWAIFSQTHPVALLAWQKSSKEKNVKTSFWLTATPSLPSRNWNTCDDFITIFS